MVVRLAYSGSVGFVFAARDDPPQSSGRFLVIVLISTPILTFQHSTQPLNISTTSRDSNNKILIPIMEVKLCVDSMKLESPPSTELSSGSESSPSKTTKPARSNQYQLPKQPKYKREELRRVFSKRKIFPGPGVIEEELDSLDSVLTNSNLLPLTVVPTYASNLSKLSRQGSIR